MKPFWLSFVIFELLWLATMVALKNQARGVAGPLLYASAGVFLVALVFFVRGLRKRTP